MIRKKVYFMDKNEINEVLDIPLSTLYDWEKEEHPKNKLFRLLSNTSKHTAKEKIKKKDRHRIFHILNRNIAENNKYTKDEIKKAFSKEGYRFASSRERIIYSRFFKECDEEDLNDLISVFHVSVRNIKRIYTDMPERKFASVANVWDRRFRISKKNNGLVKKFPSENRGPSELAKKFLAKKSVEKNV